MSSNGGNKPDSRILNLLHMTPFDHDWLLGKFAEQYRDKLRLYTGQELFYVYKLCVFQPRDSKDIKHGEVFMLSMKAKMLQWLRTGSETAYHATGMAKPRYAIQPMALAKIGKRWADLFEDYIELDVA